MEERDLQDDPEDEDSQILEDKKKYQTRNKEVRIVAQSSHRKTFLEGENIRWAGKKQREAVVICQDPILHGLHSGNRAIP